MRYAVLVSSGLIVTAYGPFATKSQAVSWAKAAEEENFCVIALFSPIRDGSDA